MRKRKFTDEQIVKVLQAAEKGEQTALALCREHGISDATFYAWRKQYGGTSVAELRRLKQLEAENAKLLRIVGQQRLEIEGLKEVVEKKW